YHARLGIWPDSEQGADLPAKEVEVVLTVLPAPSMGMLRGVVNRDRPDGPLGAGLTFESTGGMTWTTATDPETGVYGYWLDAGDYQLTASAPGYISVTVPVQVAAGQTTTQDLVLLLLAPEIELAPSGLERALEIAGIATDTLTISNTGCLLLTFSLSHQDTPNATIETGGASWLATDPSNGSVAPGEAIDVEVAFDAAVVPEPGTYRADLDVRSNDPLAPEIMVPVTMTVLPGPELGRLEGTVLGLGYCDAEPSPVEAEVTVQSAAGMSKTLSSAADTGRYASWLPAGTYTVTALAVQHQSAQAAVVISAGMTETLDLRLRWHNSCMDLAPLSVSLDLAPGTRYTETLLLANSGAGDLVWQLRETVDASALNMMAPLADGSRQPSIEEAVVLREGFDGGEVPPPGWDLIQTNARQTWELAFDFAHEGDHSAFCDYDDLFGQQDEVLLSPALALESGVLGFWSSGDLYWCRDTLDHCDLNVWLVLGDWDGGLNDDVYVGRADDDWEHSGQWSFSRFDLDPFLPGGPVRVGFQYYGRDGERIGLDSVLLEGVEPGTWQDVPWVSVAPPSGTAPADGLDSVGVHFDATDLAVGACYTASLGLLHSDPGWENPAYVPLQLCVAPDSADVERQYLPLIVRSR
ncbi:MAG: hypothetical protein PVH11_12220, partial [Anaerolineae bacterium]